MRRIKDKLRKWYRSLNGKYIRPGYEPYIPDQITIETASICNLHCSCCPHGVSPSAMRPAGIMTADTFRRVMDHLDIPVRLAYLHLHGEPFLNPNLPLFVEELVHKKISVNLYSNCTAINPDLLNNLLCLQHVALNFSADLLGQDYYENIRVGARYTDTLNKLDGINEIFARHNKFFNIIIIVDKSYKDHTEDIIDYCETLYTRYTQLNGILLGSRFPWPRLPWTGDLDGRLGKENHRCSHAFEGLSILWNGDATMCSFDYTGECVIGSMLENTYSELLNNNAARNFRMLHWRHQDSKLPLCKDCLLDRYISKTITLHRSVFLKRQYDEKTQILESFFRY